jgi:hypothetical protein
MIDGFLSATYQASRREREIEKLAQQLSNLPTQDLVHMASNGFDPLSNPLPPTPQPVGAYPTIGQSMPPQQMIQGNGLGGQGPLAGEDGMKMAAAKLKMAHALMRRKLAFTLPNAARNVNWGGLLRHNAIPLATSAAGAVAGAYMGGKDNGGLSGTVGGALLGGAGGFLAGKAGQLGGRALMIQNAVNKGLPKGVKGIGFGEALKRSWNTDVLRNAQELGYTARAAGNSGLMFRNANMPDPVRVAVRQFAANPARVGEAAYEAMRRRAAMRAAAPSGSMKQLELPFGQAPAQQPAQGVLPGMG